MLRFLRRNDATSMMMMMMVEVSRKSVNSICINAWAPSVDTYSLLGASESSEKRKWVRTCWWVSKAKTLFEQIRHLSPYTTMIKFVCKQVEIWYNSERLSQARRKRYPLLRIFKPQKSVTACWLRDLLKFNIVFVLHHAFSSSWRGER